jgi:SAM-dependent methyltransferase/tetratricopeptide (TPR) repeat protein
MTNAAPVSVQPPSVSAEAQEKYGKALTLISQGKTAEAKILLIEILEQEKMPIAFNELGKIFFAEGDSDSALGCYEEAIEADQTLHEALANAGDLFIKENLGLQALDFYMRAIMAKPDHTPYRDRFIAIATNFHFKKLIPNLKPLLIDCMQKPGVDLSNIDRTWISILTADPAFSEPLKLVGAKDYGAFQKIFSKLKNHVGLVDPLFLSGLKRIRFQNLEFEGLLTHLRRFMLDNLNNRGVFGHPDLFTHIAAHLALYAFKTDYIFDCDPEEEKSAQKLKHRIESEDRLSSEGYPLLALLGAYIPLHSLTNAPQIARAGVPMVLQDLVDQQIVEPQRLREIEKTVPVLVPVENEISQKVRGQYEESPYPRWTDFAKRPYHEELEGQFRGKKAKMLVAGCGTGREAIELAAVYPDAEILAVDLSRASLSYAIDRAKHLGFSNVTFKQADILGLGILGKDQFDFIASSGVLHHMQEPLKGWEVLRDLLKPGGIMRIGLYSRIAHAPLIEAQKIIARHNLGASPQDIRTFRKNAPKWLGRKLFDSFSGMIDYYATAECRDMFFHVQETRFSMPEIKQALETLGLEFRGFNLPLAVLENYRKLNPSDPEALDLSRWDAFERKNPRTFASMVNFWCRKP